MIPLYKPHMPNLPLLNRILSSGRLAYGKFGLEFEKKLKEYLEVDFLLSTNTFENAMFVALASLNIKSGSVAIVSPMACLQSTQPLSSLGVKIIWSDIDASTGTLDPTCVEEILKREHVDVIIHNHFCGYVGHIEQIEKLGQIYNVPIINDCIEAFGSEYKNKKLGNSNRNVTIFSFGAVRNPNTIEGGAVVFSNSNTYQRALLTRDLGINRNEFRDSMNEINSNCDITTIGYNSKMSEINSYIGIKQLENIASVIEKHRKNAEIWDDFIRTTPFTPVFNYETKPNYWVYGILSLNKTKTIELFRKHNLYASGVHINNNRYTVFGRKTYLKKVEEFNSKFVAVPCGWWIDYKKLEEKLKNVKINERKIFENSVFRKK